MNSRTRRACGIVAGVATQLVFLATVPLLYVFLRNDFAMSKPGPLWIDGLLAAQFCVPHSLLLWPTIRRRIGQSIDRSFYGSFYCVLTCASLWLMFSFWRGSSTIVAQWPPMLQPAVRAAFILSWAALFYSLALTGLGYQTGLTPWWHWLLRRPLPAREFRPVAAYRWIRHPVYLSFLGLVWCTPVITADRAVLMIVWTSYIFFGSWLKDRRMENFLGVAYRVYRLSVPGFVPRRFRPLPIDPIKQSSPATTIEQPASRQRRAA